MSEDHQTYEYSIIPGLRSSSKLLYVPEEKQIYRYKLSSKFSKYYVCYQKGCLAKIILDETIDACRKPKRGHDHNHAVQKDMAEKMQLINSIKNECKNAETVKHSSIRQIFEDKCKQFENSEVVMGLEFSRFRRQLINIKRSSQPDPLQINDEMVIVKNEVDFLPDVEIEPLSTSHLEPPSISQLEPPPTSHLEPPFSKCEQIENVSLCILCYDRQRSTLLLPCKHFKLCLACFQDMSRKYLAKGTSVLCPVCRNVVESTMEIFM